MKKLSSNSYVIIDGKKCYLEDSYEWIDYLIQDTQDQMIYLRESTFFSYNTICVRRKDIEGYGKL